MNKDILRAAGFTKEVKRVESGKCPTCDCEDAKTTIRDPLSMREFQISGMCQKCQDETFGGEEEPDAPVS